MGEDCPHNFECLPITCLISETEYLSTMLISIITPCLNRVSMVREAIESVLHQDYPNFEHIIMDGGSTDGTLEVLAEYPHLRVISQKDYGLYDAINKGIKIAQGEIIGVLNTDDYYEPDIFGQIAQVFTEQPQIEAVSGGSVVFKVNSKGERVILNQHSCIYPNQLMTRATIGESSFNAWFFRKQVYQELGMFDTHYRLLADRDFLIRFAILEIPYFCLNQVIYYYQQHPGALTFNAVNMAEERLGKEACELAEFYINRKFPDERHKKIFLKAWHTQITIEQTLSAIKRNAILSAVGYFLRGYHYDIFWPIEFISQIPSRAWRYVKKIFKL